MKDFATSPRRRAQVHTADKPYGYANHSACASTTMEMVQVSPDTFLRLERLGKRRKGKITLPSVTILR